MDKWANGQIDKMDKWTNELMDEWTYGQMDLWTNEIVDKWTNEPKVKRLELIRNLDDPEAGLFLGVCVKKITDKEMSEQPLLKKFEPASYRPFRPKFGLRAVTALSRNLGGSGSAGVHAQTGTFFPAKNVLHLLQGFFLEMHVLLAFVAFVPLLLSLQEPQKKSFKNFKPRIYRLS